ncbi:MAG TPA: leucine--tRNA ligase [Actinomycetota bacterium]|nr:leucine--tRNA ligase [Actinomycetota bacterium]
MTPERTSEAGRYDPSSIEPRWAEEWVATELFKAEPPDGDKPKAYVLDMFPYPSGDLHMGHLEAFTGGDVIARYRWMRGYNVLHPIGWDAFGLPAENAAIKRGISPRPWTYKNIEQQAASFKRLGLSFDWSRRFNTCDPEYYRWTQWLFLKFLEADLAYRKASPTNWCPSCKTVLANEQVVAGRCERCDTPVTKRDLVQWFFKETAYAERLLDDMSLLTGWSERILTMQRNWIGRSEGADVTFRVEETGEDITVFTTRPDTLWGVTFFVLAPEHPVARKLTGMTGKGEDYDRFLRAVQGKTEIERTAMGRSREGMFTGAHAINPVNGQRIPIFIADYVLMEYGTGAIMAVPAHDQRDFEFARQHGLPVRVVIQPDAQSLEGNTMAEAYAGEGVMINSGQFDGTRTPGGISKVISWLEEQGVGTGKVRYRLRDWNVSRQRGWGCPIPIVICPSCGDVPVPENQLPVLLPDLDDWTPAGTGESPLAKATDWVNVSCPRCGGDAKRETDTMDTFVDSSWYFFRYCNPTPDGALDRDAVAAWMPVDQYTGGVEHATGHLLYSRFFTKVLFDLGLVPFTEPYPNLLNQGQVILEGAAMSKSRGNLVAPAEIIDTYGADAARVTMLFAGPFEADVDWADVSPQGVFRWLSRVWRLVLDNEARVRNAPAPTGASELRKATHRAIEGVTHDLERARFNTAIAKLMTLGNTITDAKDASGADVAEAVDALVRMLQPFAPFITQELWARAGREGPIAKAAWPAHDPSLTVVENVTMILQVNGKVRDRVEVPAGITGDEMRAMALASEKVRAHTEGKDVAQVIVVPPKLVNVVVR